MSSKALATTDKSNRRHAGDCFALHFSNLVALFIILSAAATPSAHGVTNIQACSQAALVLKPIAEKFAFLLFSLGIIGTGLLALPVLFRSAACDLESFISRFT
ncbi:divalent metal cation transporter [Caballeronia udeis]|uniref:divalent metal cation transporter n=1 Tax=Caballeronia udeis TaxID=1232866 RepID=UPI000783A935